MALFHNISILVFYSHICTALFCLEPAFIFHTDREDDPAALFWTDLFCLRWDMHSREGGQLLLAAFFPEWYLHILTFPLSFRSLMVIAVLEGS